MAREVIAAATPAPLELVPLELWAVVEGWLLARREQVKGHHDLVGPGAPAQIS